MVLRSGKGDLLREARRKSREGMACLEIVMMV